MPGTTAEAIQKETHHQVGQRLRRVAATAVEHDDPWLPRETQPSGGADGCTLAQQAWDPHPSWLERRHARDPQQAPDMGGKLELLELGRKQQEGERLTHM